MGQRPEDKRKHGIFQELVGEEPLYKVGGTQQRPDQQGLAKSLWDLKFI